MTEAVRHSLIRRLSGVPDFADLPDRTLLRIVGASTNLFWRAGGVVFEAGSDSEALYIVSSGWVQIQDPDGTPVADVKSDGFFGELSLMENRTHSRKAIAMEDTELMVVGRSWFEALLETDPELANYFHRMFEQRSETFQDD